jgi:hypothetical protein
MTAIPSLQCHITEGLPCAADQPFAESCGLRIEPTSISSLRTRASQRGRSISHGFAYALPRARVSRSPARTKGYRLGCAPAPCRAAQAQPLSAAGAVRDNLLAWLNCTGGGPRRKVKHDPMHRAQQPEQLREGARCGARQDEVGKAMPIVCGDKEKAAAAFVGTFLPCQARRTMTSIGLDPATSSTSAAP